MIKVTVIIPTHNRPELLKKAVASVLKQGLENLNIIIIDDHSDENYRSKIELVAQSHEGIQLIRNERKKGVAFSRNTGLNLAKGEFILFLDDDDILLPKMLKQSLRAIETNHLDLVSCRSKVEGDDITAGKLVRYNRQHTELLNVYSLSSQPAENIFLYVPQIHTFLIRRSVIRETRFSTELDYGEDIMFWLTLVEKGIRCQKLDFVGSSYNIQGGGLSQIAGYNSKMLFYETLLAKMKGNIVVRNLCFLKMAYVSLSAKKLSFFIWIFKAIKNPLLFFRHIKVLL